LLTPSSDQRNAFRTQAERAAIWFWLLDVRPWTAKAVKELSLAQLGRCDRTAEDAISCQIGQHTK
jgi:hypothetical protein